MKNKEVIKHSGAIQVSSNQISLLQRKIWNVLLANAFDRLKDEDRFTIAVKDLAEVLNFDSKDIKMLKESIIKMQTILVQWNVLEKDDEIWTSSQFLGEVSIRAKSGKINYTWGPELRERLQNPIMYAKINLAIQSRFKSKYSLILYETCVDYFIKKQGKGETPWIKIEDFKKLMGIEKNKNYIQFKYIQKDIIKPAIEEVNKESDIFVEIEMRKEDKRVVDLKFRISSTPHSNNLLTRLIKIPKQSESSYKSEDEEKKELYERMTKIFTLSDGSVNSLV